MPDKSFGIASLHAGLVLPSVDMDRDPALKLRVLQLYRIGLKQRAIADGMGISESTLSRWMTSPTAAALRNPATDGFERFIATIQSAIAFDPHTAKKSDLEKLEGELAARATEQRIRARARKRTPDKSKTKA